MHILIKHCRSNNSIKNLAVSIKEPCWASIVTHQQYWRLKQLGNIRTDASKSLAKENQLNAIWWALSFIVKNIRLIYFVNVDLLRYCFKSD